MMLARYRNERPLRRRATALLLVFTALVAGSCGDDQRAAVDAAADPDALATDASDASDSNAIDPSDSNGPDASDSSLLDTSDGDSRDPDSDAAHLIDTADAATCDPPGVIGARRLSRAGGVVVLNELALGAAWLELHNQMAIDVDVSGWRLEGAVAFTVPAGTFVPAGGALVVAADPASLAVPALGPWLGTLAAIGALHLYNNADRLMDGMAWTDRAPWPTLGPEHASLAKRDPDLASALGESWIASAVATPGERVTTTGTRILIARTASWRHSPASAADWTEPGFDDGAWSVGPAPFASGPPEPVSARARFTADNAFALYLGHADGSGLRLVGRDALGGWESAEDFLVTAAPGEHLFVTAWEAPGDSGSPQMVIGELIDNDDAVIFASASDTFDALLGPSAANPGGGLGAAPPSVADLAAFVAANSDGFAAPLVERERVAEPWGGTVASAFSAARFVWLDTFDPESLTNSADTYALFRSRSPVVGAPGTGLTPARSAYFRTTFEVTSDPAATRFSFTLAAADGVAVYLNGSEVRRDNLPAGTLDVTTAALALRRLDLAGELPSALVHAGVNSLAVEVHSAALAQRLELALSLTARGVRVDAASDPAADGDVVINELMYHPADGDASEWIELHNSGTDALDLGGWQLADAVSHVFAPGTVIAPGGFLVIASDRDAFLRDHPAVPSNSVLALAAGGLGNDGEVLLLVDACGRTVDRVRYADEGRWPARADGGGSSVALVDAHADNAAPEAWVASDESARASWQTIRYRAAARPSPVGPDGRWQELVLGLLDAGEVLIDDVSVIASPEGERRELVTNGRFDDALAGWQVLGTHRESRVAPDPDDPANPVLHLVASGPTEHMHNQVTTTLEIPIDNGTTYEVSLRARWVAGDVQLNSRLYFNRLARTTRLAAPVGGGSPGAANSAVLTNLGPTFSGLAHEPVVPRPGESVVVSAGARDPDGIAALTLWSSIDGAPFTPTPMNAALPSLASLTPAQAQRFEAALPGLPLGTRVQLYVAATDSRGAASLFPARGPDSRALYQVGEPPPGASAGLHALRILMTPADSDRFHAAPELMSNADTGCTVIYDEERIFYDVGVRAKGSERGRPSDARLGFNVSFDPLAPLRGIYESVSIDRSEGTHTGQRELLMDLVMARAGAVSAEYNDLVYLFAPRSTHTGPALLQTARFGDAMLDNQFADGSDGRVYEYELVYYPTTTVDGTPGGAKLPQPDEVVGVPLRSLGPDAEAYRYTFLAKNNRKDDDYSGLIGFLEVFGEDDAFAEVLERVIDVPQWLRAFAFMSLAGAVDHYGAGAQHNAQLYLRPSDGRMLLFPHDLDFFPGNSDSPLVGSADLARLLRADDNGGNERRFYQALYEIITTTYNDGYLAHWRDQLGALLPAQPFASHHDFMVARAEWVMNGAPDAITKTFPYTAFAVARPPGGTLRARVGAVLVQGLGWLDVHAIVRVGEPPPSLDEALPIEWVDEDRWIVRLDLPIGVHEVTLEARAVTGAVLARETLAIDVSAP